MNLVLRPSPYPDAKAVAIGLGLITDSGGATGGLNDMGFNWLSYQGLLRAQNDLGVTSKVYTSTSQTDYGPNLQQCVTHGNDLCIGVAFTMGEAVASAATAYPGTKFAILDFAYESYPTNLRGINFASEEVGYLAGTLAGLMTQSDVVGDIGGMIIPPVTAFTDGYRNGARCANANVSVLTVFTDDFGDPDLGAQTAQQLIAQGADVIFAPPGPTGMGAVLSTTQSNVWGIGVDTDWYNNVFDGGAVPGADHLLSSAMKRLDNAVYQTIHDVVSDTFTSGTKIYGLEEDGVGLAPFHDADSSIPPSVKAALETTRLGIINGTIDLYEPCRLYLYLPVTVR